MLRQIAIAFKANRSTTGRYRNLFAAGMALSCATATMGQTLPPSGTETSRTGQRIGDWRLVRTPNPSKGPDSVSIMRTADIDASDIGFAGLTIRCSLHGRPEWLLILLEPFPVRARPQVTLGRDPVVFRSDSTVAAPGTALLLPNGVGAWLQDNRSRPDQLPIRVEFDGTVIQGGVHLDLLDEALALLTSQCP